MAPGASPQPRAPAPVEVATVLVVDDSRTIRRILRRALADAGHRVLEAADGREALAACAEQQPDLVLLDVDMPVLDGHATLEAMRADPDLAGVPVLFLTARTGGDDVAVGLGLGAQDYLRKPCDPIELTARVASALRSIARQQAQAERELELRTLSTSDPLTGLGNRRRLEERAAELASVLGPAAPAGVVLIDVDHFKAINDTEGHPIGDVVLRILAGRLRRQVEHPATLVRWGGEEFLVLAPGVLGEELTTLGEALRRSVCSDPFALGPKLLDVSVSAGCASGRLDALAQVVEAADESLYEAKAAGRNRVVARAAGAALRT